MKFSSKKLGRVVVPDDFVGLASGNTRMAQWLDYRVRVTISDARMLVGPLEQPMSSGSVVNRTSTLKYGGKYRVEVVVLKGKHIPGNSAGDLFGDGENVAF